MKVPLQRNSKKSWISVAIVVVLAMLGVAYILWLTSGFVFAFRQNKRAHVFPTDVSAVGWENGQSALTQELPSLAPFASFSKNNSAYILVASSTVPGSSTQSGGGGAVSQPAPTQPSPATFSDQTATTTLQSPQPPTQDVTPSLFIQTDPVVAPAETTPPPPANPNPPTNTDTNATTSSRAGPPSNIATLLEHVGSYIFTSLVSQAFATTTGADTNTPTTTPQPTPTVPPPSPDLSGVGVATCVVLNTTCHTLEFREFVVDGSLKDKPFQKAELKFSFAQMAEESGALDGKLSVRYFHKGHWRSAGEIYLNQELSNATNGGYFTQALEDIVSWDDMRDVRVVFEYESGGGGSQVKLFLDAVWVDAVYVDKIQDVLSGNVADPKDAPSNVSFDLAKNTTDANTLILQTGEALSFPYLTTLSDTLGVRVHRSKYQAADGPAVVYTSITNTTKDVDEFQLGVSFPGSKGSVTDISQYLRNVPATGTTTERGSVAYYCEESWQESTTTGLYRCPSTGEKYSCFSLNEVKNNCLVSDVEVGVTSVTTYHSAWVAAEVIEPTTKDSVVEKTLPPGYREAFMSGKKFPIAPGQTLYFKITLNTPDTDSRRFVISARGDAGFGSVDSLHVQDERHLVARVKVAKAPRPTSAINDQLSTKSDFNVDESPQFNFKFKSQRSVLTRVKDFVYGNSESYRVAKVELVQARGDIQHLPVDVAYGQSNQWSLTLEKGQRNFRPGKYSIGLSMNENGTPYTDLVSFYWGVLVMNTDRSSYEPGSTAHLTIAALDDLGDTMCDAELALSVTDPSGNTSDVPVVSGGGCGHNNITTLPDFVADYATQNEGTYSAVLSRLDDSGNIVTSSTETFVVQKKAPYVVARSGPTRIYPSSAYVMHLQVSGTTGFTGDVVEALPEGFTLGSVDGGVVSRVEGVIYLTWHVALNGTEPKDLTYTFKAPEVSPYVYLLGPIQLKDQTHTVFTEPNAWKIASDATSIATGVAWLAGNATTNSANLNSSTAYALMWNVSDDYDTTYFSHSTTTNSSQLTVTVAGDYLVAVTVPTERADTTGTRTTLEADVRVNGAKRNVGVGRSYISTANSLNESSSHVYVLLRNLSAGDYIESYVRNMTSATDNISVGTQASMYAEYIGIDQSAYFGLGTTTTAGTNLNPATAATLVWYDDSALGRSDSVYTHNNTSASTTISLASSGDYMVFINVPLDGAVSNSSVLGKILINGTLVSGGNMKQGYIDNTTGAIDSSLQWSGVVHATTTNEKISVTVQQDATAGTITVNNDAASIFIQQLPTTGVYFGRGTSVIGGTDWDPAVADSVKWLNDDIKDSATYTHSTTTNSHQITVKGAGDYLLALNDSHDGAKNTNEITSVSVNGTAKSGAQTKTHFILHANNSGTTHHASSGSLVYLLRNLAVNDVVTVTTVQEGTAGIVTEDQDALVMLWHKSAQSSFVQDTERWYANVNGEPPTDPWPAGTVNLLQGDAITTGNSTKSGDVLRIRMALKVTVNTTLGADAFKLQYAPGTTCSLALAWTDVGAIGSGSIWRGYDNAAVAAGATLSSTTLTVSSTTESYEEQNPSATTPQGVVVNTDGEWDWTLQNNGAPVGTDYCFRMVQSTGQVLKDYLDYPRLITNNTPGISTLKSLFDNEKTASTSPLLTFSASDDNGEDLHYEVQVSTDSAFASTVIDEDSVSNFSKFTNIANSADKAPFASGQIIGYLPTVALTNGTTYWWRVRSKDPTGTNTWSTYSSARSFTVDTSVTVSTWFQTTQAQFNTDTLSQVSATVTNDVQLSGGNTTGTIYSPSIDYASHTTGNSWGAVSWTNTQVGGTILYHVEYFTSTSTWAVIPDSDLANNAVGTTTSPIALTSIDPSVYSLIRVRADFTKTSATPVLSDWTVSWALSVNQPTLLALFNNEKTGTTSPSFTFTTTDPQSDRLVYQIQWSTDATFVTGVTTRTSDTNSGFANTASSTDVSPFVSGNTISFKVQPADVLTNGTTYWWRVRAKDPAGGNAYSLWGTPRSFTTDTSVVSSTWFQTSTEQFSSDILTRTGAANGSATATSTTGNIAIYRAASAGEAITTAVFTNGWDTTLRQDSIYSLSGTTTVALKKGHYAVMYGLQFSGVGGTTNRSEIQTNINLASANLSVGWSQGFIRRSTGAFEGFNSGGGIINVASDNDSLKLQSFRTDTNAAGVIRMANTSGLQLLKLDDSWSYARLSKKTIQTGPVSTSWLPVTYDREDEIDTSAYGHSTGGSGVTLKAAGHYLVFANTYGSLRTNNSSMVDQKLKLDSVDIDGTFTTVFMNGNSNSDGDYQGAATIGTLIQSTTTNQVLTVQVARSAGTAAWTIDGNNTGAYVDRTGLTIVKLPDADFIRLQNSTSTNMNPLSLTPLTWNSEAEKGASFTHSTTSNTNRITANTAGDYLFMGTLYAAPSALALSEYNQGWRQNGGSLLTYGQTGGYSNTALTDVGNFSTSIFPGVVNTDYFEMVTQAFGSTTGSVLATKKGIQAMRIGSLTEVDTNAKTIQSPDIVFSNGSGPKWSTFSWSDTRPASTNIVYQVYYFNASSTYSLVPDTALPGNSTGFSTTSSSVDISNLSRTTYPTLRTQATFTCAGGNCPSLNDWTVSWAQGINISGSAKQFDQTTNVVSGTVAVAVNGVLQAGKTGTISGGTWTIPNVTVFQNDIVTVFVSGASTSTRAVAVTKYTGTTDITGMSLYEMHLTLGSTDNPSLTNIDVGRYDNTSNAAIFFAVTGGNLNVCASTACSTARLLIKSGTAYEPGVGGGNVTTPNIQIDGTFIADANTITVSGSWKNNATFTKGTSSVVFTATSTSETIDSSLATSSAAFNTVTFGQTSGTATWTLLSPLNASSTLSINFGTLSPGTKSLALTGDLTIGASGVFSHGTGTTTFMGSGTNVWTDSSAAKQDMGTLVVDGSAKTVQLGSSVKATDLTIGADDILNVSVSNYSITVLGNWTNNNSFVAQAGTVTFTSTVTGKIITQGASSFYNLSFSGVGGNWAFSGANLTVSNDFTVATGTVTMPTGTTTIAGSLDSSTGTFIHNNAAVLMTTTGAKTLTPGASSFYDLAFNGSGSWSFGSSNATSSRNFTVTTGSVTLPPGTLTVGGAFAKNGGSFTHNSGTIKLTASTAQTLLLGGSSTNNLLFAGSGSWAFSDTNATSSGTVTFQSGATTLPSGTLAVGGSFLNTGGSFTNNNGTVRFTAAATGFFVTPGASIFNSLIFDSTIGGWTITGNATTTNSTTLNNASSFTLSPNITLSVGGIFTNNVGGSATTFASSTLSLISPTSYSLNTKSAGGDVYGTLSIGASANIRMWNSSAATTTVNATGSLYSQNHAGISGALNIYGAFSSASNEYWSYSNDFDGTVLSGISQRQVQVSVASSSSLTFSSGTLKIVGTTTATTTIQNQGTGAYSFSVTGGTLNAQYYQITNTSAAGLSLSGTTVVTTLSNGSFTLSQTGASSLSVTASVINQNPALQFQQNRFATSSGVTSGFNVTETGAPTSYWWFKNHYGSLAGEAYDNDPGANGGNPGYIRWDDSGYNITVAGHVYSDHGVTNIGNPPCDGSTQVVTIVVGAATYTGACGVLTSTYSIPNVQFTGDVVMTTYLNTNGGKRAVTVTKTPTADIADLDLYQNALIVRHEGANPMTIVDLATFDAAKDSDVFFTASSTALTLSTQPDTELYIWAGKTFAPGGNVVLQSGGSGSALDGRLYMASNATFTAVGSQLHSIGGGMTLLSGAVFTPANSTLTFTATTTGKSITAASPLSLYNLTFNGTGGQWSLDSATSATTTVQHAFTLTAGTLVGTGDMIVQTGDVTGGGTITMNAGTFLISSTGNFGNSNNWQFRNLTLGDGVSVATTTKTGTATTTVTGMLTIATNQTFSAGSSALVLSGGGTPFVINGTLSVQSAPVTYQATTSANIANANYASLILAPSAAGSPTYTLGGGTPTIGSLTIGNSTNPVTVTADTNDPSIAILGTTTINTNATFIASNVGALTVAKSWLNSGIFTNSNAAVLFNATSTGSTVSAGGSPFYDLTFNSSSGGWTIVGSATTTHNMSLTNAASFTLSPNTTLLVGGTFTNSVGGAATTFASSTLSLTSATTYSLNTKLAGGDVYGTLSIGASTNIGMWNSSAATTTVNSSGSLYSQNHAGVNGALNIWGSYTKSSGTDNWSYATDFDGTDISGSPRKVNVSIATSSVLTYSGATLNIVGGTTASTTVQNQGTGAYALSVSGGTLNAQYYEFRNLDFNGLTLSGSLAVTSLSNGDFRLGVSGGTLIKVAAAVIDANPLKIIKTVSFATTTAMTGYNVTEVGSPASSWKFNLHFGNLAGEAFDNDPAGDPGYIRWDDSASQITITGRVYSDEGLTVSPSCNNVTANVKLVVQGTVSYTTSCNSSTGAYSISGISFNPGDTLTLYLATTTGPHAANVTVDPISNISGMDLYENRVIVRHEDVNPMTITKMSQYTSANDSAIPFTATTSLLLPPNTKLIVWDGKTFAPGGNVTIQSGGAANTYDGSLEVRPNAAFTAAGTPVYSIGGNFAFDLGATLTSANSTFTFTATTTGKTITVPNSLSFYNMTFNGVGGNWAFASSSATSTNDVTITNGTLSLPTNNMVVGGSFSNTGGTVVHNNGTLLLNATASGKSLRLGTSTLFNLSFNGSGGGWSFFDTNATSTGTTTITAGSVTLPSGVLAVGSSFVNSGTFTHNSGTVKMTATATGKNVQAGGSNFYALTMSGIGGAWTFLDSSVTAASDFTIASGTVTLPATSLTVGGSFVSTGTFIATTSTVTLNAGTTGKSVSPGNSSFYSLAFSNASGGWTVTQNATTTHDFTIGSAAAYTQAPGTTVSVGGNFTNGVGGAATTFTSSTLSLVSGTSYSLNTKSAGADVYSTLIIASTTNIRMWNSSAGTATVSTVGSLYSQNHGGVQGALNIYGAYTHSSGTDYWSYATDFDGTALGGSSRQVNVQVASSSSLAFLGGTLQILGVSTASTTISNMGAGAYSFGVTGGTLNALYYQIRNTDANGLSLSGTPVISSLSYGDFQLGVSGGAMITLSGSVVDANATFHITGNRFATSTGITSGYNVSLTSTPVSAWTFQQHYGNYAGEAFDNDGGSACGNIRWDDSSCLFVNQAHYRWRNDDGSEGALASAWYNTSWTYRKKVAVSNPNSSALTNYPIKMVVTYDPSMKTDFSDLRFTDSSGTTTIPYYIESTVVSASSTVWVNVPSLPGSGSAVVYMYYGNGSAADASDGSATFNFYDSFENNNLTGYSGDTATKFNTGTSFARFGTYGLDAGTHSAEKTVNGIYRTGSQTGQGKTIRFYQYIDAAQQDEPCTLFGVQSSGQNYAVCLDEYPSQAIEIAKNVTSNDGSGTVLASTTVTYATGWYEVSIDWLTTNAINVTVYNPNGSVFATLNTTDSTYTSGGMGFSYWFQHGGWDYFTSRPYAASAPTLVFGTKQANFGATWAAAEDTLYGTLNALTNVRLRFSVQNTGSPLTNQSFRLQVAPKGASLNCESVPYVNYNDVPIAGSCGVSVACMSASSQFTNLASTSGTLTYPASMNFAAGEMMQNASNQTNGIPVGSNSATEVEYNFQMTNNATASSYCFRTSKGGIDLDSYDHVAEAVVLHAPTISNISLNGASDIALTEGTTTNVSVTCLVTDLNGYADLVQATSTLYRSGVGPACSANESNCYQNAPSSNCTYSACSGNSCTLTCTHAVQYLADPTDIGSTFAAQNWLATLAVQDTTGLRDTQTSIGVELLTLYGLRLNTPNINFGSLVPGSNTGSVNATTTVSNTGNSQINIQLLGTDLSSGASTVAVGQQKYSTTTFSYGSCALCQALSGSATNVTIGIPKPTSTTTPTTGNVYWGINIPNGTGANAYSGSNTFIATGG